MLRRRMSTIAAAGGLVAASLAVSPGAVLAAPLTFTVNKIGNASDLNPGNGRCDVSTNTGLQCTLRAAIQEANAHVGNDTIQFHITTTSKRIVPATALPTITEAVTINGYSQTGASANTLSVGDNAVLKIILDGTNAGATANGLTVDNNGPTLIRGLVIQKFAGSGMLLAGSHAKIEGNFIGTNSSGAAAAANHLGITLTGASNTIGESNVAARNIVSGNTNDGILITGSNAASNTILGNYIGTTKAGSAQLGNGGNGISIEGGGSTRVGANGTGNVVSGNGGDGISIFGSSNDIVTSNFIGTNAAGETALPNDDGIGVGGTNTTIGGTTASARNVISGNRFDGISVFGGTGAVVEGNFIGRNSANSADIGNLLDGIFVGAAGVTVGGTSGAGNLISGNGGDGILLGASGAVVKGNTIETSAEDGIAALATPAHPENFGPNTIGPGNVIVANMGDGVVVIGNNSTRQTITQNQILANEGLGINLSGGSQNSFGVSANDTGDGDSGPNHLQNFPVLSSALHHTNGITQISFSLDSNASTTFVVEFFVVSADQSGHGEALIYLGNKTVTTDPTGKQSSTFTSAQLTAGQQITATATRSDTGDTSEFSANATVAAVNP